MSMQVEMTGDIGAARRFTAMLTIRQTGFLVLIFRLWISKLTRPYVEMEAQGLKRRCEEMNAAS
jgi:hypothetical protein